MKVIRGTMFVSMLYYSLKRSIKLTIRRSRWNWRTILMKRRRMTLISTNKRERHWRNIFEDNEGGVDEKALQHAKRWYLYLNEKEILVKGKYSLEFVGHDKKKLLWEVVGDNVILLLFIRIIVQFHLLLLIINFVLCFKL